MAAPAAALPLLCQPVEISSSSAAKTNQRRISRVPCKARGTFENHNAWNAFIDIPEDATHGSELACSHEACAASGRRFRFCAVCALPVAHRNFVKRHGHGMIGPRGQNMAAVVVTEEEGRSSKKARVEADVVVSSVKANIPRMVVIPIVATAAAADQRTAQERIFLDLMQTRPVDESPDLSLWIQKVLDATTSKVGTNAGAGVENAFPTGDAFLDPLPDEVESYDRDQLHVLEHDQDGMEAQDDGDDCSSIGSTFLLI